MTARHLRALCLLAASAAVASCATGRPAPATTAMAEFKSTDKLQFLFGMGDRACTIASTPGAPSQDLGSPEQMVKVKPFALDVHEVTVEQYRYCVAMDYCSEPAAYNGPNGTPDYYLNLFAEENPKFNNFPVVWVGWQQAREYCEFVGKRLPTEFEWELAAGGAAQTRAEKQLYTFVPDKGPDVKLPASCDGVALAACDGGNAGVNAVGTSQNDAVTVNGTLIKDLAGNVMEWTASDADEARTNATPISATCDWDPTEQPWTCDECVQCLAKAGTTGATKCTMCHACVCGSDQELPADPTAATIRPNCYQPNNTPVCPRFPKGKVLDKFYTTKNISSKRVIRGGAFVTANSSGLSKSLIDSCFGRSDARVVAKGPKDDPLAFVGFRCAKSL